MLPETGSISMSQVNVELKKNETAVITLNDTDVRKLAGKPSGIISMEDLRGKKASETVKNKKIYSNSFEGRNQTFRFKFNFPHKVINGYITVTAYGESQNHVTIFGKKASALTAGKSTDINVPKDTLTVSGSAYTERHINNNGTETSTYINFDITFTGEWEA